MSTLEQKIKISLGSAVLLALVTLPQTYRLTNGLLPIDIYDKATNCPTNSGRLLHILVFSILTYLSMGRANIDPAIKLKHTVYGALIAYFVTSQPVYALIDTLLGASDGGSCPTALRVVVQALLYAAALTGVMYFPDKSQ